MRTGSLTIYSSGAITIRTSTGIVPVPEATTASRSSSAIAPRVHVMGLRTCHAPAYLLADLLGMVREDIALVTAQLAP
ncbi:hypothetical protein [Nocardia sp. NPDC004604]|uniref:hypothetical protein n=1 Tax=Nocardia sp. NPDC004604 TaxID=3157013 RepID=UPI0033B0F309